MSNSDILNVMTKLKATTISSSAFDDIKKVVDGDNEYLVLKSLVNNDDDIIIIPLKRKKKSDSSNIVTNWMNDIIEIIEKGKKNSSSPNTIMSEIQAYCKSVITTVNS